jgi:hypothetical protein
MQTGDSQWEPAEVNDHVSAVLEDLLLTRAQPKTKAANAKNKKKKQSPVADTASKRALQAKESAQQPQQDWALARMLAAKLSRLLIDSELAFDDVAVVHSNVFSS